MCPESLACFRCDLGPLLQGHMWFFIPIMTLPRFQDIFPAMKSCLANILVQFVQFGWLLMATNLKISGDQA